MTRRAVNVVVAFFLTVGAAAAPSSGDERRFQAEVEELPIWVQAQMTPKTFPVLPNHRPCLTPLPDRSLLVYQAAADHPLDLVPGDLVLGLDGPIAVLVGPGAVSSGDQVALRMEFHPRARFFGRATNAAFNAPVTLLDEFSWSLRYAEADAYLLSNPGEFLTHDPLPVDEKVWLLPDDVAEGRDTVVETAVEWIRLVDRPGPRHSTPWVAPPGDVPGP